MENLVYIIDTKDNRAVFIKKRLEAEGKATASFGDVVPLETPCFYILSPKTKLVDAERFNPNSTVYCFFDALPNNKNITFHNILEDEAFACKNAYLTAEGVLSLVIENTPFSFKETRLLVLGFGRCGKPIFELFKNLCATTVYATTEKNINILQCLGANYITSGNLEKSIKNYNVIINTVPNLIVDKLILDNVNKDCFIFDIASNIGGVDYEYANEKGIYARQFLALPSKYCPYTASEVFYNAIFKQE